MNPGGAGAGRRWSLLLVVAVAVAVVAGGCSPRKQPVTPSTPPTPSLSAITPRPATTSVGVTPPVTTSSTGTPTPSVDPLYQRADEVYRTYYNAWNTVRATGADELPADMAAVLTGDGAALLAEVVKGNKDDGLHYGDTPQFTLLWTRPYAGAWPKNTAVAVESCEKIHGDAYDGDGQLLYAGDTFWSYQAFMQFKNVTRLVIFSIDGGLVDSCPA